MMSAKATEDKTAETTAPSYNQTLTVYSQKRLNVQIQF